MPSGSAGSGGGPRARTFRPTCTRAPVTAPGLQAAELSLSGGGGERTVVPPHVSDTSDELSPQNSPKFTLNFKNASDLHVSVQEPTWKGSTPAIPREKPALGQRADPWLTRVGGQGVCGGAPGTAGVLVMDSVPFRNRGYAAPRICNAKQNAYCQLWVVIPNNVLVMVLSLSHTSHSNVRR